MTYHSKLRDVTPDQKHLDLFRYKRIYSIHVSGFKTPIGLFSTFIRGIEMGEMSECMLQNWYVRWVSVCCIQDTHLFWTPRHYYLQGTKIQHTPYSGHSISNIFQIQNFFTSRTLHFRTLHIKDTPCQDIPYTGHFIIQDTPYQDTFWK